MTLEVFMKDALHVITQGLLVPVMVLLVCLIGYALFCIGSVIVEYLTERRHFRAHMPEVINAIYDAPYTGVAAVIERAALLKSQKSALTMVASNMGLPADDLYALAKTEISRVDEHYQGVVARNDLIAKVGPMGGLMATLIPLGPGIVAMGAGNVETLSQSLGIAFDGTVAGLVAAVVAMVVSKVRKRWYAKYMTALEALMTCLLEKAEAARREGVELPHGYVGELLGEGVAGTPRAAAAVAPGAACAAATPGDLSAAREAG